MIDRCFVGSLCVGRKAAATARFAPSWHVKALATSLVLMCILQAIACTEQGVRGDRNAAIAARSSNSGLLDRSTARSGVRVVQVDPAKSTNRKDGVVQTIEEAAAEVAVARAGGCRAAWRIEFVAGEHLVQQGVTFGENAGPLEIVGCRATCQVSGEPSDFDRGSMSTLVGAIFISKPVWEMPPEEVRARLPEESRAHVRTLSLPRDGRGGWKAAWSGGLAGPVHSGHAVDVRAIRSELFIGDIACTPARWPNEGFAAIAEIVDRGSAPREAEPDMPASTRRTEAPRAGQFRPIDAARVTRWMNAPDAWAQGFWNWDWSDEQLPIARVDADRGVVTLGMPHRYGLAQRGTFFVTNVLEELDAPGEYWIDVETGLVFAWVPSERLQEHVSVSALASPMIVIDGAADVRIEGLAFERTRGGAIESREVTNLEIARCRFRNIGACAVDAEGSRITVEECAFEEIGGRGVRLRGGDRPSLTSSGSAIMDSRFIGCGRVLRSYNPAIDLEGVGHRVAHNEIAFHPHIAVFLRGNDHVIEANDVHDVVLETGDAGALYCGRDWTSHGNIIRGNVFSAIRGTDARFQNAVYLDDMASGFIVASNLFVNCNWGILAGGGRDNAIRDNIFAGCGKAISYDARGVGWMAAHIADPATSTLHKNLAAMPLSSEPWRTRFPTLAMYLTDRFGRPAGSSITGSVLVGTPLGRIDDRECVRVEDPLVIPVEKAAMRAMCEKFLAEARAGTVRLGGVRVGPVGPVR